MGRGVPQKRDAVNIKQEDTGIFLLYENVLSVMMMSVAMMIIVAVAITMSVTMSVATMGPAWGKYNAGRKCDA